MPRGRFSKLTVEERKERDRVQARARYAKNPQPKKDARKRYRDANQEKIAESKKAWAASERGQSWTKAYMAEYELEWSKTEKGKLSRKCGSWRAQGIAPGNLTWEEVYIIVFSTTHCEQCKVELVRGRGKGSLTLDHDHETGEIRNVLCRGCNIRRG